MKRPILLLLILSLTGALLVWSPWLDAAGAEARAAQAFETAWEGVIDGCGFNCEGCGARLARRELAGYSVELEYACGLLPQDTPEHHVTQRVYVSPLGTVHGLD